MYLSNMPRTDRIDNEVGELIVAANQSEKGFKGILKYFECVKWQSF